MTGVQTCALPIYWTCYCFEANPITYKMSRANYISLLNSGFDIKHFNFAVSGESKIVDIHCAMAYHYDESEIGSYTSQASNILESPPKFENLTYDESSHKVKAIDFSKFIKDFTSPEDFLLIKMDIEGSEFEVLDKMIYDQTFKYVNEIYVEFHLGFFEDKDLYKKRIDFYKKLFENNGVILKEWF